MQNSNEKFITDLRSSIDRLHQTGPGNLSTEMEEVVGAAEQLAEAAEHSMGSCERGHPFASMFVVGTPEGKLVWRCAHDPAHPDIPV